MEYVHSLTIGAYNATARFGKHNLNQTSILSKKDKKMSVLQSIERLMHR